MTLTLKIDPKLEQRLRKQAAKRGVKPDSYAVAAIQEQLRRDQLETPSRLSREESELLQKINIGFSQETWDRYDSLVARRENEIITPQELDELKELTRELEARNVKRIEALVELARLRNTTLEGIMEELRIKPRERRSD